MSTTGAKLNLMALSNLKIEELTRDQRLDLIETLWDSLDAEQFVLTEDQKNELDRRIDEMDRDNNLGIPWNEVLTRIGKRM